MSDPPTYIGCAVKYCDNISHYAHDLNSYLTLKNYWLSEMYPPTPPQPGASLIVLLSCSSVAMCVL